MIRTCDKGHASLDSANWECPWCKAEKLKSLFREAKEALEKISKLNPETDSVEGFNEWGEADCFNQAQNIAKEALSDNCYNKECVENVGRKFTQCDSKICKERIKKLEAGE